MTIFYLDGQAFEAQQGESVLDTLIRHGQRLNYSCKKGACKTCLVQRLEGNVNVGAQRGLPIALKQRDYLCACQCQPSDHLRLKSLLPQELFVEAVIQQKTVLSDAIVRIGLRLSQGLAHRPGQYINLRRFDGLTRSYSPTSAPDAALLQLDIRRKYNGQLSDWLYHHAGIGESLLVQGPLGREYYQKSYQQDKLIIIAYGTGLGVAHAIIVDALAQDHQGEIYLYVGARDEQELYLHRQLLNMTLQYRQFFYQACIYSKDNAQLARRIMVGDPFSAAVKVHQFNRQQQLFLCGEPTLVNQSREIAFLNGYPIERVHSLAFEYKDLRSRPRD